MSWFFGAAGRDKPEIDRSESLMGVPVRNEGLRISGDAGRLTITVLVPRSRGFIGRFQPRVMERNVRLDEVGSYVFGLIDGRRNTRDIMDKFVARYKTNRREAELSIIAFFKSLARRGVISVAIYSRRPGAE